MTGDQGAFRTQVLATVSKIPNGKVSTYGDVAALLGIPRAARGVGFVLGSLGDDSEIPWWRVVNREGGISIRHMGGRIQRMLLEKEGIEFDDLDRVDLTRIRWQGE
jgi:methylated-DNA-protein-cysteine methyltransferase related protein